MGDLLQLFASGLSQGFIYALLALAYNITFSSSKTLNFSIGSLAMIGGVIGVSLIMDRTGQAYVLPFIVPVLIIFLIGSVLGAFVFKVAVEPAMKVKLQYASILATLAFAGILRSGVEKLWGTEDIKLPSPWGDAPVRVFEAGIFPQEIFIIIAGLVIVACFEFFKHRTLLGRAVEAVSEDADTAALMGIDPKFVMIFSYALSSALALIAGLFVAPITLVSPTMGVVLGIKSYIVSIIGGLQSGWGTLAGGLILAFSEVFTARYFSTGLKDLTGFTLLFLIILFKPNGLFGSGGVRKV